MPTGDQEDVTHSLLAQAPQKKFRSGHDEWFLVWRTEKRSGRSGVILLAKIRESMAFPHPSPDNIVKVLSGQGYRLHRPDCISQIENWKVRSMDRTKNHRGALTVFAISFGLAWGLLTISTAQAEIRLLASHGTSRLDGIKVVGFANERLTLDAAQPGTGLLVFWSNQPVVAEGLKNAQPVLKPGWDGTVGYSHYKLEVTIPTAGEAVVRLHWVPPPSVPVPTTQADMAAFRTQFQKRPSRFPADAIAFRQWQQAYRERLAVWLMGEKMPGRVPLEARVTERQDFPKFTLRRVQYRSQKDRTNMLLLSLPKGVARAPVLLALHGHECGWGQADAGAFKQGHPDDFCGYFAERGWAVLQPATMNHTLQHPPWTLQGEWTWDAMVGLDYAAAQPEIDMARAAVCGLSTGGHLAMNVLALDDRVKAGVVGCVLSTWNHYRRRIRTPPSCDCGIEAQIGSSLEQCDWAALAAPKPVQFQHGRQDAFFCPGADARRLDLAWSTGSMPQQEYDTLFAEVERAWALAGDRKAVVTRYHGDRHKVDSAAALEWLERRGTR